MLHHEADRPQIPASAAPNVPSNASFGGDQTGSNLRTATYSANSLNQYSSRTIPGYFNVLGTANSNANVLVEASWGPYSFQSWYGLAYRKGEFYRAEVPCDNSSVALWLAITNIGLLPGSNSADIQTNSTGNSFLPRSTESFSYDPDGNLTNDGHWTYSWDAENRLVQIVANSSVGPQQLIKCDYDWRGRRIRKRVWNNTSGSGSPVSDSTFLYNGWNLLAEMSAYGNLQRAYVWGVDLSGSAQGAGGVGGLIEVNCFGTQATNAFPAFDANGNLAALVSASTGRLLAQYEFGPFGEVIRATGPMCKANPFRFSTKYQDDESDLLYYGYRFYGLSTGRWTCEDPLEEKGGKNLYAFALNDPVSHYDLLGLTIPGQCGAAYYNWCPCKCVSVTVTFSPGDTNFKWSWLPNMYGGQRLGNDMSVVWKVDGPAMNCRFFQQESGNFFLYNSTNPKAETRSANWSNHQIDDSHGTSCWGERSYTDAVGTLKDGWTSPSDDGDWQAAVSRPPKITVVCQSSDGTKKTQAVTIPDPNPGKFPP